MSFEIDFNMKGDREILEMFKKYEKEVPGATRMGVMKELAYVFRQSQILVPVKDAILKGSGWYDAQPGQYGANGDSIGGQVVYHTAYAARQHEMLHYRHKSPTCAKYLAKPFEAHKPNIERNVVAFVFNYLKKMGKT